MRAAYGVEEASRRRVEQDEIHVADSLLHLEGTIGGILAVWTL